MELIVARVARAHGLHGEVVLDLRTDNPELRLQVGATFTVRVGGTGREAGAAQGLREMTVTGTAVRQGRWFVTFAGVEDRTAAESLRGVELVTSQIDESDDESWYRHELVGLAAVHINGEQALGTVIDLEHPPAHDVLVIREPDGTVSRVPFVRQIVPQVDIAGGRVVLDPPGGLLVSVPPQTQE